MPGQALGRRDGNAGAEQTHQRRALAGVVQTRAGGVGADEVYASGRKAGTPERPAHGELGADTLGLGAGLVESVRALADAGEPSERLPSRLGGLAFDEHVGRAFSQRQASARKRKRPGRRRVEKTQAVESEDGRPAQRIGGSDHRGVGETVIDEARGGGERLAARRAGGRDRHPWPLGPEVAGEGRHGGVDAMIGVGVAGGRRRHPRQGSGRREVSLGLLEAAGRAGKHVRDPTRTPARDRGGGRAPELVHRRERHAGDPGRRARRRVGALVHLLERHDAELGLEGEVMVGGGRTKAVLPGEGAVEYGVVPRSQTVGDRHPGDRMTRRHGCYVRHPSRIPGHSVRVKRSDTVRREPAGASPNPARCRGFLRPRHSRPGSSR